MKDYWRNFYETKKFKVKNASSFAKFCLPLIKGKGDLLVDVGCGNGRDSYYFAKNGVDVIGIDRYTKPKDVKNASFIQNDFTRLSFYQRPVYARFLLHSIESLEIITLLEMVRSLVMLEFRNVGDKPKLYRHERNLIDGNVIFEILVKMGFEIIYFKIGMGMAKYKTENPLICRIIARKF